MKKLWIILITVALMIGAFMLMPLKAEAATEGVLTYTVSNGEATITDCDTSDPGELVIPATLGGYPVTSIGDYAFSYCFSLTSVEIPDSVTSIGEYAFYECENLTSVVIPDSVTSIGEYAFHYCISLTSVEIPDSVTCISDWAFYYCRNLTSVVIGDSVTSIGGGAFYECDSLTSIEIPNSVTSIGGSAFYYCRSLTSIAIPDSVTSIGNRAFEDTAYYNNTSNWKNEVLYIGNHLIEAKTTISGAYTIKEGTKTILGYAFEECSSLTSVVIPDSVTSIGDRAFSYCSSLTSVVMGDSVTSIGDRAFYDCSGLIGVYISDITSWCNIEFSDYASNPLGYAGNLYLNNELITELIIPEGVTSIGDYAFCDCSSLTSVVIPEGVTSIGDDAFEYCSSLTSVVIPDSVTSINTYAFAYCSSLTSVVIPEGITSIERFVFGGCSSLTSVFIPDSVMSIGGSVFYNCNKLKTVYYGGDSTAWSKLSIGDFNRPLDYVTKIYDCLVYDNCLYLSNGNEAQLHMCYNKTVTNIVIPEILEGYKVTLIEDNIFNGCANLANVVLPGSLKNIGENVFLDTAYYNDENNWENDVLYIGEYLVSAKDTIRGSCFMKEGTKLIANGAFKNCSNLTSVLIPESVKYIGEGAFSGCGLIKTHYLGDSSDWDNIVIGENNDNLIYSEMVYNYLGKDGVWVFAKNGDGVLIAECDVNASGDVVIPETYEGYTVNAINTKAFYGCTDITSVSIPNTVKSIGSMAFYYCSGLTEITIPDSVASIVDDIFSNCSGLKTVNIGSGISDNLYQWTFSGCSALENVNVSENNSAYSSNNGVLFNKDKTTLIFYPTGKTSKSYTIPNGVTKIEKSAFSGCAGLTNIRIPDSVTRVGKNALYNTGYYNSIINWENGTLYLGDHLIIAQADTTGKYSIVDGTKYISEFAFEGCTSITSITIPESVTDIAYKAFSGCSGLTTIDIPSSVKTIEPGIFHNCTKLSSITVNSENADFTAQNGVLFDKNITTLISYPAAKYGSMYTIPNTVENIYDFAFHSASRLTYMDIPDSVEYIGNAAFSNCSYLTHVEVGDGVSSIGDYAFYFCDKLESVALPKSLESVGAQIIMQFNTQSFKKVYYKGTPEDLQKISAGIDNDNLFDALVIYDYLGKEDGVLYMKKSASEAYVYEYDYKRFSSSSLTIPSTFKGYRVTEIADSVFKNSSYLTSITLPDSITKIGRNAFYNTGYYNNTDNWENNVLYIGNYLIASNESLYGRYTIKTGTKLLADYAFETSSNLATVRIPDSVTEISYGAFYNCSSLAYIDIPDTVVAIGEKAFGNCTSLSEVYVGEDNPAYSSIDGVLFSKDGSLLMLYPIAKEGEDYVIPEGVTSIGNNAFNGCVGLSSITVPNGVTSIGEYAFYDCTALKTVYYEGSDKDWNNIVIGDNNEPLLKAKRVSKEAGPIEIAVAGTSLKVGVMANEEKVIIVPTVAGNVAMTEAELAGILKDEEITITSNNGIIGTGCKITIGEQEVTLIVKGDIDGDGIATVFDALMVKKALAENSFTENDIREFAGDIDGEGVTDTADVDAILAHIVGEMLIA